MVRLSEEPRPGKGKGSQTKDEKKDESETESKKKPPNWTSQQTDESQKKTAEEHIPKNPWNLFQRRLKDSGFGSEKKRLAALYREEQTALRTREGEGS